LDDAAVIMVGVGLTEIVMADEYVHAPLLENAV
jgi:hypothetical protein